MERGAVLACQFHPELSGVWGSDLLRRWLWKERLMLAARVIPCLDIKDGRVVKGVRFQQLRDAGDPVENAAAYEEQGADEIILLDVSATPEGRGNAVDTVRAVRSVLSIPLTVGGGVRRESDAGRLLDAGADKVGINTAAVQPAGSDCRNRDRVSGPNAPCSPWMPRHGPTADGRSWCRAGPIAPVSTLWNGVARQRLSAPGRYCSPAGTVTAPVTATTWT